jgi:hypothetical protein
VVFELDGETGREKKWYMFDGGKWRRIRREQKGI